MIIFIWIIQLFFIVTVSPFFIGFTRKIKARLQNREGASLFQPYYDIWKLFHKDEVISYDASWIFMIAPYIVFSVTLIIGMNIPLIFISMNGFAADFLVIVYLFVLYGFFLALAGLDTGGGFGGFGSSREMFVASLTEGSLIFSFLTLALIARGTNLFAMVSSVASLQSSDIIPVLLAFISFSIAMLAETSRYPFDNPATHLELTMIHEAMILEYSGKRLALMEWASANKYVIFIALGANVFLPWGIATSTDTGALMLGLILLICKMMFLCLAVAVLESSIAKLRIFKLPELLFTSFIISIIAIGFVS